MVSRGILISSLEKFKVYNSFYLNTILLKKLVNDMGKTKKTGISARFGPRYGSNVRKKWRLVMEIQKSGNLKCPRCETRGSINRISTGIWHCKKCNAKFTGGAYNTQTPRGAESFRIAKRKQRELETIEE